MPNDKWYKSEFANLLGWGLVLGTVALGFGSCTYLIGKGSENQNTPQIINYKEKTDGVVTENRFVDIGGERFYSVYRGKNLERAIEE